MKNLVWKLIDNLAMKKGITEVMINAADNVYVEREGELTRLNVELSKDDINHFCADVAKLNKVIFNSNNPIIDGLLPDGSRVNVIAGDYTSALPVITIRKYLKEIYRFDKLNGKFNLTDKWINFFKATVGARCNILVSGGTGVGKTTFLNLLLQEVSLRERIVVLEDTKELKFDHPNCVRLFTPTLNSHLTHPLNMRALVKNSLRMRPDRIIMGEIRGAEAFDLLQVMNTGHDGSMCTIHANGPQEALMRLENLSFFAGHDIPVKALRFQIMSAIDFIVQLGKDRESGRVVTHISEVCRMEGDKILLQDIGVRSHLGAEFTGLVPKRADQLYNAGLSKDFFIE